MRVTPDLIHPELRLRGTVIRALYRPHSERLMRLASRVSSALLRIAIPIGFHVEQHYLSRADGTALRVLVCYQDARPTNATGLLWLHGGGHAVGAPEQDFGYFRKLLRTSPSVIVTPDYRLSVAAPYPAALDDAYLTLHWMQSSAAELGINPNQLFVGGQSSGGGLAVGLAAYARDQGEVNLAFLMPLYPMLDDRTATPSARDNDAPIWDSQSNRIAWRLYLGELSGREDIPPYAAPARLKDHAGLPPTYTFVGTIEPFFDETLSFVAALRQAGVAASGDAYRGCFHAFDLVGIGTAVARRATQKWLDAYRLACATRFAPQPPTKGTG